MGSDRSWLIIITFMVCIYCSSLLSSIVVGSETYDPEALDTLIHYYANQTLAKHHKGTLLQVPLPSNFSGMEVSIIRIRSGSLWNRGLNSSFIKIEPRVRISPYVKRIAIFFYNMAELSSKYYQIPGYSLVSSVIGFGIYEYYTNSTRLSNNNVTLITEWEPVTIHFPYVDAEGKNVTELKCVRIGDDGSVEFKNMTRTNVCVTGKTGHFSVVVPSMPEEKERTWRWWVVGFVAVTFLLVMLVSVGIIIFRLWTRMKIKTMEKESDRAVALDTFWVRGNKMPSASTIRTQPVLEHDFVP